jgi:hypothetical protein
MYRAKIKQGFAWNKQLVPGGRNHRPAKNFLLFPFQESHAQVSLALRRPALATYH